MQSHFLKYINVVIIFLEEIQRILKSSTALLNNLNIPQIPTTKIIIG